jgi:hypothetical protein
MVIQYCSPPSERRSFTKETTGVITVSVCNILERKEDKWAIVKKLNSVALARERTITTERPPLVGEVSANFCG